MSCGNSRRTSRLSVRNSFADASASALAPSASAAALASRASTASKKSGLVRSPTAASGAFQSQIEQRVINSKTPIQVQETEQVTASKWSGIYVNKSEVDAFRGPIPIEQYQINEDCDPELLKKRLDKIKYTQEVAVRYLRPPAGPKPGDIIIREIKNSAPPAPPVVIRQEACQAQDPKPLVFRQRPPQKPCAVPEKVVEIEGCPQPPPPRRVVVEKLSSLPPKPQNIIVEKWLPYCAQKRRVVFQPANDQAATRVRNLVIEWEAPEVEVEKICKNLGVVDADPDEYERRYGNELKDEHDLPDVGNCGCAPQACQGQTDGLEGDLDVLRRVDLDKYGLSDLKKFL